MFTDRQWNQIRAALLLWQSVTESSRVHPAGHRSVRHLFETLTPLTDREIALLADSGPQYKVVGYPIKLFADTHGISAQTLLMVLRRAGVKVVCPAGASLYRREDLQQAVDGILARRRRKSHEKHPASSCDPPERDREGQPPVRTGPPGVEG